MHLTPHVHRIPYVHYVRHLHPGRHVYIETSNLKMLITAFPEHHTYVDISREYHL